MFKPTSFAAMTAQMKEERLKREQYEREQAERRKREHAEMMKVWASQQAWHQHVKAGGD